MRSEAEVRRRLAETQGKIDATPLRKPVRMAVLIAERVSLRWVLGEVGEPPRRT